MRIGELNIIKGKSLDKEPILYIEKKKGGNTTFRVTGGIQTTSPFLRFWRGGTIDDCPPLANENITKMSHPLNRILIYGGEGAMFGKPSEALGIDNKNIIMKRVRIK